MTYLVIVPRPIAVWWSSNTKEYVVPLTVYGFVNNPSIFAITKSDAPCDDCVFFLDFIRPLDKRRWCGLQSHGFLNKWIGPVVGLGVPVRHVGEEKGGYLISVHVSDPYFADVVKWWKLYFNKRPAAHFAEPTGSLEIIADFYEHFPSDCQDI